MKNIANKIVKIISECAYVQKNGVNQYHNYKYATAEDVISKVNAAMVKHKVCPIVTPTLISLEDVVNQKGNTEHLATMQVIVKLLDAESGESLEISGLGSGQDAGDKAIMKAQTASIKYAYIMSFAIATGDDPEADCNTDEFASKTININKSRPKPLVSKDTKTSVNECSSCGEKITDKVMQDSQGKFGKALCMSCQKEGAAIARA